MWAVKIILFLAARRVFSRFVAAHFLTFDKMYNLRNPSKEIGGNRKKRIQFRIPEVFRKFPEVFPEVRPEVFSWEKKNAWAPLHFLLEKRAQTWSNCAKRWRIFAPKQNQSYGILIWRWRGLGGNGIRLVASSRAWVGSKKKRVQNSGKFPKVFPEVSRKISGSWIARFAHWVQSPPRSQSKVSLGINPKFP